MSEKKQPTQAQKLVELAGEVELFHTPDLQGFATIYPDDHFETHAIRSKGFRLYLTKRFYEEEGKPPASQPLQEALGMLEARAIFDGERRHVFTRIGQHGDSIYLDLGDAAWRAVETTPDGWRVTDNPVVKFRRSPGMLALPEPVPGSIEPLKDLLNYGSDQNFILIVSFLVAALRPKGPYTILAIYGEHGAAKSTQAKFVRQLVDPSVAPLRSAPRSEEDLMIAATNSRIVAIDNLSYVPAWLSDALCRLSTGGGISKRQLYTDADERILTATRPIILTAIEPVVDKTDLVDRSIIIELPTITDHKDEDILEGEFNHAVPGILGGLLDAVVAGLRHYPETRLDRMPRMADFAKWVTACEPSLPWSPGTFMSVYQDNRAGAVQATIDLDLIASSVQRLMETTDLWEGTSTNLLDALESNLDDRTKKTKQWPATAAVLSKKLRRSVTFLRSVGIAITFPEPGDNPRVITIRKALHSTAGTAGTAETRVNTESQSRGKPAVDRGNGDLPRDSKQLNLNDFAVDRGNRGNLPTHSDDWDDDIDWGSEEGRLA